MKLNWLTETWRKVQQWAAENSAYSKKYNMALEGLERGAPEAVSEIAELTQSSHYHY